MTRIVVLYRLLPLAFAGMLLCVFMSCGRAGNTGQDGLVYTCPMHPEVREKEPGKCPICKMKLVPVSSPESQSDTFSIEHLLDPTNSAVISDIESVRPSRSAQQATLQVHGVIAYDERLVRSVAARVDGRIERLYVKYRFQPVKPGLRLFDLYSPELLNEQRNFIFLLKNEDVNSQIVRGARTKLKLLGLTEEQVRQLENTREVIDPVPFYSPAGGHLHVPGESAGGPEMRPMTAAGDFTASGNQELFKEGMYVRKGQVIFQINGTSKVWAVLTLALKDASGIKEGTRVEVVSQGDTIPAQVDFIEPAFREGQSFVSARVYLGNTNSRFKIGENITAVITHASAESLFVPSTAVISLGLRSIVFIREGDSYRAKVIQTGSRFGSLVQVLSGLDSATMIAKNASYLIDSESFVSPDE